MKTTRSVLILTLVCFALSCVGYAGELSAASPKDVGMFAEKLAGVKTVVQGLVDDKKIAGATVVVARKGKIAFFETFGMMDIEAKKPMAKNAILRFYSMTKPITSVALMMLYEEGKIKLDGKRILKTETVEMMTRNQLPEGVSRGDFQLLGLFAPIPAEEGEVAEI